MKQLLNDSVFKNCYGQVDSVLPKNNMATYRPRGTCRCIKMCIYAQELVYYKNKNVLQIEWENSQLTYFNMIMKAGIAHYFYYCEDNKIAWFWYQCKAKKQMKEEDLLSVPCATTFPVTPPPSSTFNFRFQYSGFFAPGCLWKSSHSVITEMKAFKNWVFWAL